MILVSLGAVRLAVKDVGGLRGLRRVCGRWLLRREARAYAALHGLRGIPRLHGFVDADGLALEYLEGDVLRRESMPQQSPDYFDQLRALIEAIHGRGWLHLDLGHRRNVLVLSDGRPGVVDFQTSLRWAAIPLLGHLGKWIDRRAIRRLERRYGSTPRQFTPKRPRNPISWNTGSTPT